MPNESTSSYEDRKKISEKTVQREAQPPFLLWGMDLIQGKTLLRNLSFMWNIYQSVCKGFLNILARAPQFFQKWGKGPPLPPKKKIL